MFLFQMKEVSVYCMSKAAMDMFTQCMALGNVLKQIVRTSEIIFNVLKAVRIW
jgi:NAD(P)-dependent dehydrogenase (short-subunit alcohol dehydrogenase family)